MTNLPREPRVIIVGAGVSGIATAHALQQAGFTDWIILEKGSDVGGVWYWNHYPGLTCDVPSQLYQFSFAPKPDWERIWATGPQIQNYHREVVDNLGITSKIKLDTEVLAAEFDEATNTWRVDCANNKQFTADFLVCATGILHNPSIPDIPGLNDFAGPVVHTARWDNNLQTKGKRIAVLGTGSTGVQVVSALQAEAKTLSHFVRSPQWVLWAPMNLPQPRLLSKLLSSFPKLNYALYQSLLWCSGIFTDITTKPSWRRRIAQSYARFCLRAQIRAPQLQSDLTPDYQPLCKRQVVSGSYYRALQQPNIKLVTSEITKITNAGIHTKDGKLHEVDLIVLATGFRAHDYMRPMLITGRDGMQLSESWANGPRGYRMTAIPGFPNLFTVLGPNSPTGSISLQFSAELTGRYIAQWLEKFRKGELNTIEVTEEATNKFNAEVSAAMGPTVWNTGCNSWYLNESGSVDLWPFDRATMKQMLSKPDERDFLIERN
ncbi:MAG: flavin-containing monooxygenase [Mycobacteriaceae bacterium]